MGMFWCRPDVWISVDKKNREYAANFGVSRTVKTGTDYLAWLKDLSAKIEMSPCEFSHQAHLRSLEEPDDEQEDEPENAGATGQQRNYWLLAPGEKGYLWDYWYNNNFGAIGWNAVGDFTDVTSEEEVVRLVAESYPKFGKQAVGRMLWEFSHELAVGDVVFAKVGLFKTAGWGIVTGAYQFDGRRSNAWFFRLRHQTVEPRKLAMIGPVSLHDFLRIGQA